MKVSEAIHKLSKILTEDGDLDILGNEEYPVYYIDVEESDGSYPENYNMPLGYKFVRIETIE